jgi:SAM-dependent methyltransferase
MPYKERYFDAVVSTDVLEHVLDLNLAVKEILGVVKEGGIIVIRVPYREDLGPYLHPDFPYRMVHLRSFDENSLRLLFEKIFNVKVLEVTFAGYEYGCTKFGYVKFLSGLVRRVVVLLRRFSNRLYKKMAIKFMYPAEINVVIKNSQIASELN